MAQERRKWSEAQKLRIIQEAEQNGLTETLRKYNLSQSLFHRWRKAYNGEGMEGLKPHYKTVDPEVKRLQQENERLKRIIAKQALEIDFKDELLKKRYCFNFQKILNFTLDEGELQSIDSTEVHLVQAGF